MRTKYYILFVGVLQFAIASAQSHHINFTSLTSRDGLLSNSVNSIWKDRQGFMWFATDDGLNKFDGTNFTIYRHIAGDSNSLRANEVLALYEDKAGNLWIGTSGGAFSKYDRNNDRFINYPQTGQFLPRFLANAVIRSICGDYLGKIWIAQYEAPYMFDPVTHKLTKIELAPFDRGGSVGLALSCVFEDSRHRMWVGTDHGLFLYDRASGSFRQFRHDSSDRSSLVNNNVIALAEDKAGRLWVGTDGGLCQMQTDPNGGIGWVETAVPGQSRESRAVTAIASDEDGMLWIGTLEGLHILDPRTGHTTSYLPDQADIHSLTSKAIRSIYMDKEGIYWVGTYWGGINKYDKNLNLFNAKLSDAFHDNTANSTIVKAFAEKDAQHLWVGTAGGGLYEFNRATDRLSHLDIPMDGSVSGPLTVMALKTNRSKKLYIGTNGEGLIVLDPVTGRSRQLKKGAGMNALNSNDIYSIQEDSKGQMWIGTNGDGVDILTQEKVIARYTPHPQVASDRLLPINGYIRAIQEDVDGNIWIGTHGGGIAVFHPPTRTFTIYNQMNSRLPGDKISSLLLDSRGKMWIGTYGGGLSAFNHKTGQFDNFSEADGLINTSVYQVLEDARGHIWVSTNTGISCLDVGTGTFRNFTIYNGLQNSNFAHASGIRVTDGELFFGGLQGFNYLNPAELTTNRNVPEIIMTDLKIANKSVIPGDGSPLKENISVAREIRLDYGQNFTLGFVALNYTLPKQNHYAYKLEGFDKDWNNSGTVNTAYYTNLDPGEYTFRVKAGNNDGVWSSKDCSIRIIVKPPVWRSNIAFVLYVLVAGGLLFYSRHRAISRIRKKFEIDQETKETRRIQELERLKLKFLTNLSHEFRTPIALILGPVDQLLTELANPPALDKLRMVRRNASRLLNLVNEVLDFRKMEEKELRLQLSGGEFVSFLRDVCHSFTDLAERKHIEFNFSSSIDRLYVRFDRDKMERILFNLLSNAFKFTLEGGAIRIALEEAEGRDVSDRRCVSIKVIDTGIGIPYDKQESIFERFFQDNSPSDILNQGTGIGLSIVREFVKLHGGSIDVQSEPGCGSVFIVQFPLLAAIDPMAAETRKNALSIPADGARPSNSDRTGAAEKASVLVIEDNEDFRTYIKELLNHDYTVIEAANGKEGWQKSLSGHPHLIVSDISMPYMDGIELARKLKADRRTSHIPIILLTALTKEEQELNGLETGANDYITKPFSFEALNAKIRNLLELKNNLKETYCRQIKLQVPKQEVESEDERLLLAVGCYLEENLTSSQLSVESLSKHVAMSRSSLYNKLLEITGETPVEYIRSYKLAKAAILLQGADLTIAEVAYRVGFSTPNYFAKAFRAKFQMLPSEFAARAGNENQNIGP